ncbi:uncharacterized protein DNG_04601 [Cephalotrichum gorgonifer]|uniref:Uncharacterized protein n=1 Tax=Cephalotrichum gorgonifer TaxID=2041049 RepID=A0AAE8MYT5_9PEZI|nr:uncharacterized protein DNG_04601 [Cephalotrichum gorgonifer]
MAHPFSHLPTPFIVSQGDKSWWANCAWCAFGLASMLVSAGPVTVSVKSGAIGDDMRFSITQDGIHLQDGPGEEKQYIVHYSVPPSTWWSDVKFACGTIHLFKDRKEALDWCDTRGFDFGVTMGLETMWKLAKAWYEAKASYGYNRKTPDETSQLFHGLGMVSKFWTE